MDRRISSHENQSVEQSRIRKRLRNHALWLEMLDSELSTNSSPGQHSFQSENHLTSKEPFNMGSNEWSSRDKIAASSSTDMPPIFQEEQFGIKRDSQCQIFQMVKGGRCEIQVFSKKNGLNNGLFATLDTGTKENWISQRIVDRLGLKTTDGSPMTYTLFNGKKMKSTTTVKAIWCVRDQNQTTETTFRVGPSNAPFEVLFGRRLLESEEVDFHALLNPLQMADATEEDAGFMDPEAGANCIKKCCIIQ